MKNNYELKHLKVKHKFLMWCAEDYTSLFTLLSFVEEFCEYKELELLKTTTLKIAQQFPLKIVFNL